MQATRTISGSADISRAAFVPAQKSPAADAAGTCACGQVLDARHSRCTRCGR